MALATHMAVIPAKAGVTRWISTCGEAIGFPSPILRTGEGTGGEGARKRRRERAMTHPPCIRGNR